MSLQSEPATIDELADDRSLRLPAHCTTVTAEDIRVRLVLAADLDTSIQVDASDVESVGQATLQLLVAARTEARANGQIFSIVAPSSAFVQRVVACRLAEAIGLEEEGLNS
ncbi:MAG TPA: STAS domain-containing protein [Sphingomonas sp.]|jgi:anti-anti-sigma regulatory factor|nr:STAS domain-containing protein [Sphingomonas sp.]